MQRIERWFAEQRSLSFVGSSILFVREGDAATIKARRAKPPLVKMIDFAHTYPSDTFDVGYHTGASNCAKILAAIAEGRVDAFKRAMADGSAKCGIPATDIFAIKGYPAVVPNARLRVTLGDPHFNYGTSTYSDAVAWLLQQEDEAGKALKKEDKKK